MLKVKTTSGTAFDEVAYQQYGYEHLLTHLLDANPDLISEIVLETPQTLSVPEVELKRTEVKPPWRQ